VSDPARARKIAERIKAIKAADLALAAAPARAQLTIEIVGGAGTAIPIAVVPFEGESAFPLGISGIVAADLERSGLFRPVDTGGIVPRPARAEDVRVDVWRSRGADAVTVGSMLALGDGRVDGVEVGGRDAGVVEDGLRRPHGEVARGLILCRVAPLTDAGAAEDPLVGRVHDPGDHLVRDDLGRNVASGAADDGRSLSDAHAKGPSLARRAGRRERARPVPPKADDRRPPPSPLGRGVAEIPHERRAGEDGPDRPALRADPAAVDDPDLAEAPRGGFREVVLHDGGRLGREEGVEVDGVADRDGDRIVPFRAHGHSVGPVPRLNGPARGRRISALRRNDR